MGAVGPHFMPDQGGDSLVVEGRCRLFFGASFAREVGVYLVAGRVPVEDSALQELLLPQRLVRRDQDLPDPRGSLVALGHRQKVPQLADVYGPAHGTTPPLVYELVQSLGQRFLQREI